MMRSEDEHTQVFKVLDLVLEVNDLKQRLAAKDKALRDIRSALEEAIGVVDGHVNDGDILDTFSTQPWKASLDAAERK